MFDCPPLIFTLGRKPFGYAGGTWYYRAPFGEVPGLVLLFHCAFDQCRRLGHCGFPVPGTMKYSMLSIHLCSHLSVIRLLPTSRAKRKGFHPSRNRSTGCYRFSYSKVSATLSPFCASMQLGRPPCPCSAHRDTPSPEQRTRLLHVDCPRAVGVKDHLLNHPESCSEPSNLEFSAINTLNNEYALHIKP